MNTKELEAFNSRTIFFLRWMHLSIVTVKHLEKILHLETTFKTSKKDSSQGKRQTDGMHSNKWLGVIHVKHMSKDNNNNKTTN